MYKVYIVTLALDVLFRQTGAFDKAFRGLLSTDDGMSWFFFTNCHGVQRNPPCSKVSPAYGVECRFRSGSGSA